MRNFVRLAKNGFAWKNAVKLGCLGVGISLVHQKYLLSCEEAVPSHIQELHHHTQSNKPSKDLNATLLTSYSSLSDLIIHHKTESECIVLLPNCSSKTRDLILSSLARKREEGSIRVIVFDPSEDSLTDSSDKAKQHELEKKQYLSSKVDNAEFIAINSSGDIRFFSLDSIKHTQEVNTTTTDNTLIQIETNQTEIPQKNYKTEFQKALNFFYPPKTVRESDFPTFVDSISNLSPEERIVACYIPESSNYLVQELLHRPNPSSLDSFKATNNQKNIPELERRFRELSYSYVEKHTRFVIVRSSEIALSLSISEDDIGEIFLLKRSSNTNNNQSNLTFAGKQFLSQKIESATSNKSTWNVNDHQRNLYMQSLNSVQIINIDTELKAFLLSQQEFGKKKFLVYFSAEALEQEYEEKVINKLADIRKNINDNEFTIIFTKNPTLLKHFFAVIPDRNSDTVRFLDFSNKTTVVSDQNSSNTSQLSWDITVNNSSVTERRSDDSKSEFEQKAGQARRYKYEGKITRNKLSFFIKQAISNSQQSQQYKEGDETILSIPKTAHLNAGNFVRSILEKGDSSDTTSSTSDEISIVYFYKPGCPNCSAMGKAFEKFQEDLTSVKSDLQLYDSQEKKYYKYDETLLNKYRLDNHNRFKSVSVYRYNIYNECKEFPSPSAAPLVFIFTKHNRLNPIQADLLKDRVNINDSEKVSRYLFKKVDLLSQV